MFVSRVFRTCSMVLLLLLDFYWLCLWLLHPTTDIKDAKLLQSTAQSYIKTCCLFFLGQFLSVLWRSDAFFIFTLQQSKRHRRWGWDESWLHANIVLRWTTDFFLKRLKTKNCNCRISITFKKVYNIVQTSNIIKKRWIIIYTNRYLYLQWKSIR